MKMPFTRNLPAIPAQTALVKGHYALPHHRQAADARSPEDPPAMPPADGYPLTFVELTRWNRGQHQPLGCPRHRSPQPLVAGSHETTDEPMWICPECGYATPVLDDELNSTLGATEHFTAHAFTQRIQAATRFVMLPATAATNYSTGMVTLNTATALSDLNDDVNIRIGLISAGMGLVLAVLIGFLLVLPLPVGIIMLLGMPVLGAVIGTKIARRRRAAQAARSVGVSAYETNAASDVVAGEWITRPTRTVDGVAVVGPAPAPILNSAAHAARVLQNVRIGNTAAVRITTTAGTLTVSDTAEIGVVELADPALNDFTYQPRG